ncbi:MAG: hypothetical protein WKG01_13025 [Kofleriaceae bacterium]
MTSSTLALGIVLVLGCAVTTAVVISAWRFPLAPPTPSGGGIAIWLVAITAIAAATAMSAHELWETPAQLAILVVASGALTVVGAIDDARGLSVRSRLVVQLACALAIVVGLPATSRFVPTIPLELERAILVFAIVWFVNLTNFMDGIDWLSIASVIPITAALTVLGSLELVPDRVTIVALALGGATLGFAPFNRPVARLFLGDAGSLPIGLILAWLLILTAAAGQLAAAGLLPLYAVADTTITLGRRWFRGQRVFESHQTHFYQLAIARGWSVPQILARVIVVNGVLAMLAIASALVESVTFDLAALGSGAIVVAALLRSLSRGRP